MFKKLSVSRLLVTTFFFLTVLGHVLEVFRIPPITALERNLYDWHLNHSLTQTVDPNVVIANIDEKSIAELGQWPWRRDTLAQFLDALFDYYEIAAIGFDVVFPERSENVGKEVLDLLAKSDLSEHPTFELAYESLTPQLDFDKQFADAIEGNNVVLGIVFERANKPNVNALPTPLVSLSGNIHENNTLIAAQSYVANLPQFHKVAAGAGFFDNPLLDEDGVLRRVPLVQQIQGHVYPSLSLELLRVALGSAPISLAFEQQKNRTRLQEITFANTKIPVQELGDILVPYRGQQGSFAYLSIIDIATQVLPKQALKNKIVLVGTDAAGLLDLRTTPFSNAYPGVEVHANVISGILEDRLLQVPEYSLSFEVIVLLLSAVLLLFVAAFRDVRLQVLGVLLLIFFLLVINQYFWQQGLVLPLASSLVLACSLAISLSIMNMVVEARHKKSIVQRFGQYVHPELVTQMSNEPDRYALTNESKTLTVLFMDVRDFTSISENMTPEQLSDYLNVFLTAMTEVIHECNGTIDKYMGDAIMAFWGAPIANDKHASDACRAALKMRSRLEELNLELEKEGLPAIYVGIGINTDTMFVGNMGSEFRTAYTVMGDAVNLAARLEALTKQYGVTILVGENTFQQISSEVGIAMLIDFVRVKGKSNAVRIYQLCDKLRPQECESFSRILENYRNQQWQDAKTLIQTLNASPAFSCKLLEIYQSRISQFEVTPPGKNWDGVFTHTTK